VCLALARPESVRLKYCELLETKKTIIKNSAQLQVSGPPSSPQNKALAFWYLNTAGPHNTPAFTGLPAPD